MFLCNKVLTSMRLTSVSIQETIPNSRSLTGYICQLESCRCRELNFTFRSNCMSQHQMFSSKSPFFNIKICLDQQQINIIFVSANDCPMFNIKNLLFP